MENENNRDQAETAVVTAAAASTRQRDNRQVTARTTMEWGAGVTCTAFVCDVQDEVDGRIMPRQLRTQVLRCFRTTNTLGSCFDLDCHPTPLKDNILELSER